MLEEKIRAEIGERILECFKNGSQIERLTATHPQIEVEDAYRIQEKVIEGFVSKGDVVKGYKVGLTSKVMQKQAGTDEPDFSAFLASMMVSNGATANSGRWFDPFVEIEIAFVMKSSLKGPGVTVADVALAVDHVVAAIEVVDFRIARTTGLDVRDSIADLAAVGGVVLGEEQVRLSDVDIKNIKGALKISGIEQGAGKSDAVMGNPLNAVAWLANKLSVFGAGFDEGDVILSGSFVRAVPIKPGTSVVASFDSGLGDVRFHLG